jgi:GH15 family glucan-1,4-alpha-glucosidase
MSKRIEDYALIGDLQTAALVSRDGSIDWLCFPRFDSDACLAALLGTDEHGTYALAPTVPVREIRRRYKPGTLILETDFVCDQGSVRVIDFMTPQEAVVAERHELIRMVVGLSGEVPMALRLSARFGYGVAAPWIQLTGADCELTCGPETLRLNAPMALSIDQKPDVRAAFTVRAHRRLPFVLTWHPSHQTPPQAIDPERLLRGAAIYWEEWSSRCTYQGQHRELVLRSLITIKALTFAPTGAIAAAPTTSLPEQLGGPRNWDYRYCWVRDASLSLNCLVGSGFIDEATAFQYFLIRSIAGDPQDAQIMYGLTGERRLTEFTCPWLPGYEHSSPVRVGNAASEQFQLDIYGEAINCLYLARRHGMAPVRHGNWPSVAQIGQHLLDVWKLPDDGIWEVRSGRRHFTYSKVMAWVAFDRAIKLNEQFGMGGKSADELVKRLRAARDECRRDVETKGYDAKRNTFTQYYGSTALDASLLVMPHYGFLAPNDPRMQGTVRAIEGALLRDGFVRRYDPEGSSDGLPGDEGAFLACSFWLVDNYAWEGRMEEAEALFDRLTGLANDVGLLSEEYDGKAKRLVGNYPQAFSHLGLITSAVLLDAIHQERAAESLEFDMTGRWPNPPAAPPPQGHETPAGAQP